MKSSGIPLLCTVLALGLGPWPTVVQAVENPPATAAPAASVVPSNPPPAQVSAPLADLTRALRATVPDLPEVPAGVTNAEAYLASLAPRVLLARPAASTNAAPISRHAVYPRQVGYVRIGVVDQALPASLEEVLKAMQSTNSLAGLVLDLRFAGGDDFPAAVTASSLLASRGVSGLRLGQRELAMEAKPAIREVPVVLLTNRRTRGAAELLAAAVRQGAKTSLMVGTNTAGEARTYRELALGEGRIVQAESEVATLGKFGPCPPGGLAPDVAVAVSQTDEEIYLTNEYRRIVDGRPIGRDFSSRLNEAELVRRRRNGRSESSPPRFSRPGSVPPSDSNRPTPGESRSGGEPPSDVVAVQDPVLGRALDLITGWFDQATPSTGDSR